MHNGNIGIVLDNIPSYTRLQRVLLHEAIGHQGLDALFGDSYFKDEFLMKVYRSMPSEWKLRGNSWNARKTDAEEYLADLASNGVSSSAWNQIYGELRNMLRIFIPGLNFSEREIRNILIRSKKCIKKGRFNFRDEQKNPTTAFKRIGRLRDTTNRIRPGNIPFLVGKRP